MSQKLTKYATKAKAALKVAEKVHAKAYKALGRAETKLEKAQSRAAKHGL